jgi:hypothetical protein
VGRRGSRPIHRELAWRADDDSIRVTSRPLIAVFNNATLITRSREAIVTVVVAESSLAEGCIAAKEKPHPMRPHEPRHAQALQSRSTRFEWTYLLAFASLAGCAATDSAPPVADASIAPALDASTPPAPDASFPPTLDASTPPEVDAPVPPAPDASAPADAGESSDSAAPPTCDVPSPAPSGRWTSGDLHVHTIESDDAQVVLSNVLEQALSKNGLDWLTLSNHLRLSSRDADGATIPGGPIPESRAIALYEAPAVVAMQTSGLYAGKTIFSSVEWDMPAHDHFGVGVVSGTPQSAAAIKALNEFEYRFTNRDPSLFDPADVAGWGADRGYTTHADSLKALAWLEQRYPTTSYGVLTHPFRHPQSYKISDFRDFHDAAPHVFLAFEGMVGNQLEPDRGGYASPYVDANAQGRTYGGVDATEATLGGMWDALLGEGRRIWNVGDSDFHFKTAQGQFSSGYFPGEYTRNYVWVDGADMPSILAGLRSGKAFTVYGNLISALDFRLSACAVASAEMGGALSVPKDAKVRITIRWKSELPSNYETPVGSGHVPGAIPKLDHVDLISGDVTTKAQPGTPAYDDATNPSARVVRRFDAAAATIDAEGYHVVTLETTATKNQYFRLRGTNLGVDVPGETANGEPLADAKIDLSDNQARFDAINDRNYADLWFYSNPVFLTVTEHP